MAYWQSRGKTAIILACTDHDPKGLQIADLLHKNIADLTKAILAEGIDWNPDNLTIDRFGLTRAFIDEHRLTWIDNLLTGSGKNLNDHEHQDHNKAYVRDYIAAHGVRKVEANVLVKPRMIPIARALCEQTILKYVDLNRMAEWQAKIGERRDETKRLISEALSSSDPHSS